MIMSNYDSIKQPEEKTPEYYLGRAREMYGDCSREVFKVERNLKILEKLADFLRENAF